MVNFILPNLFQFKEVNDFIITAIKHFSEGLKYKNINICGESGNVPYLSWGGGINSNLGNGIYYNHLIDFQRAILVPRQLNMSNVLLEDYDYNDCLGQTVLNIFHDGSTILEISSIPFMEKINHDYPNYRFIFSKQADLINEFTPEILEGILNIDGIVRIGIPDKRSYDLDWLRQLSHKNRYEITVNPYCPLSCANCDVCSLKEHQNQLDYSCAQLIANCNKRNDIYNPQKIISLEEIVKNYQKMGFSYFTFNYDYGQNANFWISFYVDYFFKPEYHNIIFAEWAKYCAREGDSYNG